MASKAQFDLKFETSNLDNPGIHVHIASKSHFGGLLGHGGLQIASEVTSGLRFELTDLKYLCSHVSKASKCHYSIGGGGQISSIDFVSSTEVKLFRWYQMRLFMSLFLAH